MTAASADRQRRLRTELGPGEHILWQGAPDPRKYVLRGSWFLIPFSLLWLGFAIFWEASAIGAGAPDFFSLWGIPFILIGLYMAFGRFFVAWREARNTSYAVTDRRILIETGAFGRRLIDLDLRNLPALELQEQSSGTGTIRFTQPGLPAFWSDLPGWPGMPQQAGFVAIPRASEVYRTIRSARESAPDGAR